MISLRYGSEETGASPRADDLFSQGCALGSSEACRLLVVESLSKQEGTKDDASRQTLFRQACDRGATMGCLALYDSLKNQPRTPGEPLELPGLLKRACLEGDATSCSLVRELAPRSDELTCRSE
ncbi:hypothetical protein F0U61_10740 [Archangium violaceum]|uniref:hypothetical protein n=1 Tax=Archangium violaceum TaxID=83451 RepID=UPI002B28605F|nr:hypothetical protein F0U61_10740 [Archangium violaceum]